MLPGIRKAIAALPQPIAQYVSSDAAFDVFRAKDLHATKWNGGALQSLVFIARSSYLRYGKRPRFDAFDAKAAIYIVRARYRIKESAGYAEEWLSVRMVPGDGKPSGLGEPEIHEARGKSVDYWMRRKLGARGFWKKVASSSRMCGIHPYTVRSGGKPVFLQNSRHRYTAVCFALIHKQFALDYPLIRFPYRYITAIIRPDFYKERLAYVARGKSVRPTHAPAHSFLGMRRNEIRVKRGIYTYPFPLYWLHAGKLLSLINRLRGNEHKSPIPELKPEMFLGLAKTGRKPVIIAGIRIAPEAMRRLVDQFVPDAPELKITGAASWYRGMEKVLRAAKVVPREGHMQLPGNSSKIEA